MTAFESLIEKIKKKPEFSSLPDSLVSDYLSDLLKKHNLSLDSLKYREEKIIIKEIRAELRNITGQFQKKSKRSKLLSTNNYHELLKTHSSTAERLDFYPKLRELIKNLNVSSILDLGCGLNPIALAEPKYFYYASDIREDELSIIKDFFSKNNIKGEVFTYDLRKIKEGELPNAGLCILFKVLDVIEKKTHKLTNKILEIINSKYFLVSFATKKLSGKSMHFPERKWFEHILERKSYKFDKFNSNNEIFYLFYKSP